MKEIRFMVEMVWENSPHECYKEVDDNATEEEIEDAILSEILNYCDYWR